LTDLGRFTGAGPEAIHELARGDTPSPDLENAITAICDLAASRGVRLLFDAEHASLQPGIDSWTLEYMKRYNKHETGKAVVYNTYQAYLKGCATVLAQQLAAARKEGFTLGVKLVRGAYIASDPRHLIHDTKADTDDCYNSIAESILRQQYSSTLKPISGEEHHSFPPVNLVLAGHNLESTRKSQIIRNQQAQAGEKMVRMEYAQLQGMADEVSCELLQACQTADANAIASNSEINPSETKRSVSAKALDAPQVYKYLVWGTTGECMKYLLRRAQENKDAVGRTREARNAMAVELLRRVRGGLTPTSQ
jgi:proline dehydrogenase